MKGDENFINFLTKIKNIKAQLDDFNCNLIQDQLLPDLHKEGYLS